MRRSGQAAVGVVPAMFLAAALTVSSAAAGQQTIADHFCSLFLGAEEQTGGLSENLDFLKPDTLLYGRPGADFGKGSTAVFATDFSQAAISAPLPKAFSWADYEKKPAVRDQGSLGTCWAMTAAEAVESALLPQTHLVLSADHISLQNGFDIAQDEGGDYSMIMSYMADFKGPVTEAEDPGGDGDSPQGLKAAVHVEEMRLLEGMSADRIRHMIYRFGAVQTSLSMDRTRTTMFWFLDGMTRIRKKISAGSLHMTGPGSVRTAGALISAGTESSMSPTRMPTCSERAVSPIQMSGPQGTQSMCLRQTAWGGRQGRDMGMRVPGLPAFSRRTARRSLTRPAFMRSVPGQPGGWSLSKTSAEQTVFQKQLPERAVSRLDAAGSRTRGFTHFG